MIELNFENDTQQFKQGERDKLLLWYAIKDIYIQDEFEKGEITLSEYLYKLEELNDMVEYTYEIIK